MRTICIYTDGETPCKSIEEVPEGTTGEEVKDNWIRAIYGEEIDDGVHTMNELQAEHKFFYVHPVMAEVIRAAEVPDEYNGDSIQYTVNGYRLNLYRMIEVAENVDIGESLAAQLVERLVNFNLPVAANPLGGTPNGQPSAGTIKRGEAAAR